LKKNIRDSNRKNFYLKKFEKKHGIFYDYTSVDFSKNTTEKQTFTCPIHGNFESSISRHSYSGCPNCGKEKKVNSWIKNNGYTQESFLRKVKEVHPNLNFNKFIFKNIKTKSVVTCNFHGDFIQNGDTLLNKRRGCPKCGIENGIKNKTDSLDTFILKANIKHIKPYDYSRSKYINSGEKIEIICPVHGSFWQLPYNHLQGKGCHYCFQDSCISNQESEIYSYIKELNNNSIQSHRPEWLDGKELDVYVPEFNFGIEFNGTYWHSEEMKDKWYHFDKTRTCKDNGVILLHIWEHYWNDPIKQEIYKSKIRHFLKMDNRIYARKCTISSIDKTLAIDFVRQNHLEGFGIPYKNSKYIGLFKDEQLLMVAIYGEFYQQGKKSFVWKLQRVASLKDYTVVGGVSKISKYITNDIGEFVFQVTLDTGGTLVRQEFTRKDVSLRYWWIKKDESLSRNQTQVSILKQNLDWVDGDTEDSYMKRNRYLKVWDSGIIVK